MTTSIKFWDIEHTGGESAAATRVLRSRHWNEGGEVAALEDRLAKEFGVHPDHVVACSSGTMALFLALLAHGIGPGDEVIIPAVTFAATANAVEMTGASVLVADVNDAMLLDVPQVAAALKKSIAPAAIIPVHVSGRAALANFKSFGLPVIDDACESFPYYQNDTAAFSFTANKLVTCGQGGALVSKSLTIASRARVHKKQGRIHETHDYVGTNGKMTDMQAAVLVEQLSALNARVAHRMKLYGWYQTALAGVKGVKLIDGVGNRLWPDVLFDEPIADRVFRTLRAVGIESRKFWPPLTQNPPWIAAGDAPNAERLVPRALWLPANLTMTKSDVQSVADVLKAAV